MSENLTKAEFEDWYDNGEGSENMKRKIAKSARKNPTRPLPCDRCAELQARIDKAVELNE